MPSVTSPPLVETKEVVYAWLKQHLDMQCLYSQTEMHTSFHVEKPLPSVG